MVSLMVLGIVALVVLMVMGVIGAVLSLVFGLLILPFKLMGLAFRGIAFLLALPILLVLGIVGVVALSAGILALFSPLLLPLAVIAGLVWLLRRRPRAATT